jgi:hypothetical protein
MPVHVQKKGRRWLIVEAGGQVVGHSSSRQKAQASANARNAARHGWRPSGKPARYKLKGRRP